MQIHCQCMNQKFILELAPGQAANSDRMVIAQQKRALKVFWRVRLYIGFHRNKKSHLNHKVNKVQVYA